MIDYCRMVWYNIHRKVIALYEYSIFINGPQNSYQHSLTLNFYDKDYFLYLSSGFANIRFIRSTNIDSQEIANGKNILFNHCVKKALLLHLLLYSNHLNYNSITIIKNHHEFKYASNDIGFVPIFSLIDNTEISSPFTETWQDLPLLTTLGNIKKSDYDSRMSSLFALISAKSKKYEIDRFVNLWISFNGMYIFFSNLSSNRLKEREQLGKLLYLINHNDSKFTKKQSDFVCNRITKYLKDYNIDLISNEWLETPEGLAFSEQLISEINNYIRDFSQNNTSSCITSYTNSAYCFLLVELAYYFRCKYIHANKVVPLFSFENEHEIKCLCMINRLLEDFIDNNLCKWFDTDYVNTVLLPLSNESVP